MYSGLFHTNEKSSDTRGLQFAIIDAILEVHREI
jgi:hypothetical protein